MYYNKFNSYNMKIKNDLSQEDFIKLCIVVANKHANQQPSQPLTKLEGSETNSII